MVKAKNTKITQKALREQIKILEEAIAEKIKSGDIRGLNAMQKKLTKLKRQLKSYQYKK